MLVVIGLAGIPDDIESWHKWFSALHGMGWFTENALRWSLVSIGACLLIWVNYPAIKNRLGRNERGDVSSTLRIEFEGDSNVLWDTERHPLFPTQKVQRKFYGVWIFNSGDTDIENVSVEVERIEQIPEMADEIVPPSPYLGLKCRFKQNGAASMNFPPGRRDRVPIISHVNSMVIIDRLRLDSVVTRCSPKERCTGFGRRRGKRPSAWRIWWRCLASA